MEKKLHDFLVEACKFIGAVVLMYCYILLCVLLNIWFNN